jgi:hypothetical protein
MRMPMRTDMGIVRLSEAGRSRTRTWPTVAQSTPFAISCSASRRIVNREHEGQQHQGHDRGSRARE